MIIGNDKRNGIEILKNLAEWADEIIISVAFIKESGWNLVSEKFISKKKITIITGENFYQTEPDLLLNMFETGYEIYFYQDKTPTFHSKIYLFKRDKDTKVLLGSANLTKSGLTSNYEASMLLNNVDNENEIKTLSQLIESYFDNASFNKISSYAEIEGYRFRYSEYHKIFSKAKKDVKKKLNKVPMFRIEPLVNYIEHNRLALSNEIAKKDDAYLKIKDRLDFLVNNNIESIKLFVEQFDIILSGFYSSGLHRNKNEYYPKFKSIISLLHYIKNTVDTDVARHYTYLVLEIKGLNGFSLNVLTEILNTYYPNSYPVMNKRVLKVMNALGLMNKKTIAQIKLFDYKNYIRIISEVKTKAMLNNYRDVDFVISKYYNERIKKKLR